MVRRFGMVAVVLMVGATAWGQATRPGVGAMKARLLENVEVQKDIEYARPEGNAVRLDLYRPKDRGGLLPVIVWIHGGAWRMGNKGGSPAAALATQGYATVSIDYRLVPKAVFPAQIYDCKAAIRWVRANAQKYGLDGEHIGVWGASAGGHLVALLGTSGDVKELEGDLGNNEVSSRVQAVCDFFGPADFLTFREQYDAFHQRKSPPGNAITDLVGGLGEGLAERLKKASPVSYITKDAAPFLILQGDKDPLVPLAQSEELNAKLKEAGVESELMVIAGQGHGGPGFGSMEAMLKIKRFFDKHLKPTKKE